MSQCCADGQEAVAQRFSTTLYRRPAVISEASRTTLAKKTAGFVRDLMGKLDTTVFRLLVTAQSTQQFKELANELFPEYVDLSSAVSTAVRVMDHRNLAAVAEAAFASIRENLLKDECFLVAHGDAKEESIFCLDSLHRSHFLTQDAAGYAADGILNPDDYLKSYQTAIAEEWWSLLHLHCILFAMRNKIQPTKEVFFCLMEGFRHSVMSYAHARTAIDAKYRLDYSGVDFSSVAPDSEDRPIIP